MRCFSSNFYMKSFHLFVNISLWVKDGALLQNISMVFWRCNREERIVWHKKNLVSIMEGKGVTDKRKKTIFMQEWDITTIVNIFISKKQHPFDITDVFEDERLVLRLWYKCKSRIPSSNISDYSVLEFFFILAEFYQIVYLGNPFTEWSVSLLAVSP